jgi:predicted solute-binding protein
MTKSIDKNDVVVINLDRPRILRFGHKALKKLGALTGKGLADLGENDFDLEELEKILYCGLLSDAKENGETLKLEDMEDLLDQAESYNELLEAMNLALTNAFGQGDEKN